jgi:hypothetical protein
MGIVFKKNGRPRKTEKALVKNINAFLSSLGEEERSSYAFDGETVNDPNRLEEIWEIIMSPQQQTKKPQEEPQSVEKPAEEVQKQVDEDLNVDKETGEIFEQTEKEEPQDTNFVNKEETMEDTNVLDELDDGTSGVDTVDEVPSFFNPLADPVKERSYSQQKKIDVGEIEEVDFGAQKKTVEEILEEAEEQEELAEEEILDDEEEEGGFSNLTNEAMNDLDPKDQKLAAKQLVQTVLDGYEMLHEVGKNFVKYPEDKLQEKVIKGEIDPTMEIPIDEMGNTTNPVAFFQEFNAQAEEAISYDPEFGEKVRPAMERVFAKKGWGMTDEQFLLVAFGKDLGWKAVQVINLRKTAKGIMNTFEQLQREKIEAMERMRREQAATTSVHPDSITTPPKQEPRVQPQTPPQEEYVAPQEEVVDDGNRGYYSQSQSESTDIVPIHGG